MLLMMCYYFTSRVPNVIMFELGLGIGSFPQTQFVTHTNMLYVIVLVTFLGFISGLAWLNVCWILVWFCIDVLFICVCDCVLNVLLICCVMVC